MLLLNVLMYLALWSLCIIVLVLADNRPYDAMEWNIDPTTHSSSQNSIQAESVSSCHCFDLSTMFMLSVIIFVLFQSILTISLMEMNYDFGRRVILGLIRTVTVQKQTILSL